VIDDLLRPLTVRDPAVAPLAVVASLAVELQPALLRRLRRRLVPEASPLTEALLWSSELAGSRTASTLLLADDVQVELRRRLARDQLLLDAARAVIVEAHAGVAEILRCEEDLVYYGLVDLARLPRADLDQATLDNRIRDRLEQVLGSIVADPARRQYLLAWSARALPSLPERVQTHEAGGFLVRYIAGERVGAVLAPSDRDAAIGVRWTAAGLVLSALDRAPTTLRVPPIQPLLIEITLERDGLWSEPRRVIVPAQDALTVPLEDQVTRVRLLSLRGDGLVLHRQPATATTPFRLWVLVAGAAADEIPAVERRAADTLGRAIGAHGLGLITGAHIGIDQITAEAFLSVAPVDRLVSIVREGRTPSVSAGIVRLVASDLDEYWEAAVRADGVVVLSDTAATREVARVATLAGRPVFAFPGTPAANLLGVAPIPKDVAMHAGIAAEGILRSISQRRATPSPLSRWAGPALLAAAIDCLRVDQDQSVSRIDRLWHAVLKRDAPDDAILDDTIARHPAPERLLHYMLLQHRLIRRATADRDAQWFEPLVDAIVEETAFASEFQEARLLRQGLLALHDHLGYSPADTLRFDLELRLQAVEDRLQQFTSGEPRDACERLFADILARFADNPLRNLAGRYEHTRATEPSNDDRVSALDGLMLDARKMAAELGVRAEHITGLYKGGRAGLRVVALACCAALPDQAPHDVILGALAEPATTFELWTAVNAAAAVLDVEPPGTSEPIAAALLALQAPSNNPARARGDGSTLRHASVALANYAEKIGLPDDTDLAALRLWLAASAGPRSRRGTVVVIGSSTPNEVPFCEALGTRLAAHGWRLVSGRGYNVGPHVVAGYRRAEGARVAIYSTSALDGDPPETRVFDRLEDARVQMVAAADCGIVICGGDGTRIECELALAKPMPLLALPFTGGTAARIADTTRGHLADLGLPPPILGLLERDDRLPPDEQAERTVRVLDIVLRRWFERRLTRTDRLPRPTGSPPPHLPNVPMGSAKVATVRREQDLHELLCHLFDGPSLRRFVRYGAQGEAVERALPGDTVSLAGLADAVVAEFVRRGLVPSLWARLREEYPLRRADIDRVAARWTDLHTSEPPPWPVAGEGATFVSPAGSREREDDAADSGEPVDVAILVALREEWDVFWPIAGRPRGVGDPDSGRYLFPFKVANKIGRPYRCVALCMGDMGPAQATDATHVLLQARPRTVVNLGIAAAIHDDLKLCDVVVADQVDDYLATVKAAARGKENYAFELRGSVYKSSYSLVQDVDNLKYAHPEAFGAWHASCSAAMAERTEKLTRALKSGQIRDRPDLARVHLASGPVLAAAESFSHWVRTRDGLLKALDMEAAGMMLAAHQRSDPTSTLVLRGISDFGDERKAKTDRRSGGAFRYLAMYNATRLLWAMLEWGMLRKHKSPPDAGRDPPARDQPVSIRGHHAAGGARSTRTEGPPWDAEARLTEVLSREPNAVVARLDVHLEGPGPTPGELPREIVERVVAKILALGEGVQAANRLTPACYHALSDVVTQHASDGPGARRILQNLLAEWLPRRYGRLLPAEVVERSSATDACADLRLETSRLEIAEARVSHEDGRPASYASFEGSGGFRPRNSIPLSDAIFSEILPANEAATAIAQAIARQLPNPLGTDLESIRDWLAFLRKPGEMRRPQYVVITSEMREKLGHEVLQRLKESLPALRLVELGQSPSPEESRIGFYLLAIFKDDEPVKNSREGKRS